MRAILTSQIISALGSQLSFLALPWFVLSTTGSAARMGLVFAVELLPIALFGIPSGLLVQRLGLRRTVILGDAARGPLIGLVPALHFAGVLSFPMVLVLVFLSGLCTAPYLSAQRLLIPESFGDDAGLVTAGNGLLEGAGRLASLAGPALSGGLIAAIGAVNVLWLDAASFAVSCTILTAKLPLPKRSLAGLAGQNRRGVLAGTRFVLGNPVLRQVSAASLLFGAFFPLLLASLPVLARTRYGGHVAVAGLLYTCWGGGALLGVLLLSKVANRLPPIPMGAAAAVCLALPLWLLAFPLPAWGLSAVLLVSGVFTPMLNAPLITLIMLRTPEELRAQVIAFVMTANLLVGPVGYAVTGPLLGWTSVRTVFLIMAAGVSAAAGVLCLLLRVQLDPASPAEATATVRPSAEPIAQPTAS